MYFKGDDQFLELSLVVIMYGKGLYVWDFDGNEYFDCFMGFIFVSFGYVYGLVVDVVKKELENGVNFQCFVIIEWEIVWKFLELVLMYDMIKFVKNGFVVIIVVVKLVCVKIGCSFVVFLVEYFFYFYDDWFIGKIFCNVGIFLEVNNFLVIFNVCDFLFL